MGRIECKFQVDQILFCEKQILIDSCEQCRQVEVVFNPVINLEC